MTVTFKHPVSGEDVAFDGLPEISRQALVNRGLSHLFGNECTSVVSAAIRSAVVTGTNRKAGDVATAEIQAYRADESNGAFISDTLASARAAKMAALLEGTLGVRVPGESSIDPIEAEMTRIAGDEMRALFAAQKWIWPRGKDEDGNAKTFKMGDMSFTASDLITNWIEGADKKGKYGTAGELNEPRIRKAAERAVKAKASLKAKAAVGEKAESLSDLF
jgi:hypothetical protein